VRYSQSTRRQQLQPAVREGDIVDPDIPRCGACACILTRDATSPTAAASPALARHFTALPLGGKVVAAVELGLLNFDQRAGATGIGSFSCHARE
jgi:hypothetical protein